MDPALLLLGSLKKDTTESVGFLNDMMFSMWPFINVATARLVKELVEPMFEEVLPGPFKNTVFRKIDLGPIPLKFDDIDVISESKTCVRLYIDVHWDGNCDIELNSPIIQTYGVESIKLQGRVCVLFKPLLPVMPIVGSVQVCFINPPTIDLDFTGIADIADVSLIRGSIRKCIAKVINNILVMPNRIFVPISPALDFFSTLVPPVGIVRLTVEEGRGFKPNGRIVKDVPDVYCKISLGAEEFFQTKTINNSCEPVWKNQHFDFQYCDPQQMVHLHVWDDDVAGDDKLGACIFPMSHLLDAPDNRASIPLRNQDGKLNGSEVTVHAKVRKLTSDKSNFDSPEAADVTRSNICMGLITLVVAQARDIPDAPDLTPYVKVYLGEDHQFQTPVVAEAPLVDPRRPHFNSQFQVLLTPAILAEKPDIKFELNNMSDKTRMGSCTVNFDDILNADAMSMKQEVTMDNGAILKLGVFLSSVERS